MKCNYCTATIRDNDEYGKFPDFEDVDHLKMHLHDIFVCGECIRDSREIMDACEILEFYMYLTPTIKKEMEKQNEEYKRL